MAGVLIVGYGNELRSDDGAGYHLALRLADDPRLAGSRVLACRQLTPELALDASQASRVILLDASTQLRAGQVAVRRLEVGGRGGLGWSHHMTPAALVGLAGELYGGSPETYVVSLGVASLEMDTGLSAQVEAALPSAAETVVRLVRQSGHA